MTWTEEELHDLAEEYILAWIEEVDFLGIAEYFHDSDRELSDEEHKKVANLIGTAHVDVYWYIKDDDE